LGSGKLIEAQLFGVRARDPMIMAGVATLIALCASAAVMIPARRAARIDPTTALRVE
jgi:ABC-type lipoprotein release transport system permease subunit